MFANGLLRIIFGINSGISPGRSASNVSYPGSRIPKEPFTFDTQNITFVLSGFCDTPIRNACFIVISLFLRNPNDYTSFSLSLSRTPNPKNEKHPAEINRSLAPPFFFVVVAKSQLLTLIRFVPLSARPTINLACKN